MFEVRRAGTGHAGEEGHVILYQEVTSSYTRGTEVRVDVWDYDGLGPTPGSVSYIKDVISRETRTRSTGSGFPSEMNLGRLMVPRFS